MGVALASGMCCQEEDFREFRGYNCADPSHLSASLTGQETTDADWTDYGVTINPRKSSPREAKRIHRSTPQSHLVAFQDWPEQPKQDQPAPRPSMPPPEEFKVTLVRRWDAPFEALGVDLEPRYESDNGINLNHFEIVKIFSNFVLSRWNSSPEASSTGRVVQVGDAIRAVNGVQESGLQMLDACRGADRVEILVKRLTRSVHAPPSPLRRLMPGTPQGRQVISVPALSGDAVDIVDGVSENMNHDSAPSAASGGTLSASSGIGSRKAEGAASDGKAPPGRMNSSDPASVEVADDESATDASVGSIAAAAVALLTADEEGFRNIPTMLPASQSLTSQSPSRCRDIWDVQGFKMQERLELNEFKVDMVRWEPFESVGMDVKHCFTDHPQQTIFSHFEITKIYEGFLLNRWNKSEVATRSARMVSVGDRVVMVNNVRGDCSEMIAMFKSAESVALLVRRAIPTTV